MAEPNERQARSSLYWRYFAATYIALLINHLTFLKSVDASGALAWTFAGVVYFTGALVLQLLGFAPLFVLNAILGRKPAEPPASGRHRRDIALHMAAVGLGSAVQGYSLLDGYVFGIYGFHLNGMVWNLVMTPGGVNSMAAGLSTTLVFISIVLAVIGFQAGLLAAVLRVPRLRRLGDGWGTRRRIAIAAAAFAVLLTAEKLTYAVSVFRSYDEVPSAASSFPLYVPITFTTALRRMGFNDSREGMPHVDGGSSRLSYPLKPLRTDPAVKPLNIVWLVSESLRADMLDPAIMPAASAFAGGAVRFQRHYSGGNGTRMGMFSMFYGLTGNYWQSVLSGRRGPVLLDRVIDGGYQLIIHTSAEFSFPELDKTVFSRVPRAQLREGKAPERWKRDRENVDQILASIDARDPSKPFFTFMFFESPHAPYTFPEECAVTRPYVADLNYLTMDLQKDIGPIKNSYINACRHLDTQLDRVFRHLREKKLLESTLVLVTGDHGEEFMEKGRWGHHSAFSEEQIRVPLILHVPGVAPAVVDRMTSHLDLPATVLARLGVTNPPEEFGFGFDLLGGPAREYTAISGWTEIVYVDDVFKAIFPTKSYQMVRRDVMTRDDGPADKSAFLAASRDRVARMLMELKRFQ